mgnify:FL=1
MPRLSPPSPVAAQDVKDAIEDVAAGVLAWTPPEAIGGLGKKSPDDCPFRIGQAAGILAHRMLFPHMALLVQRKDYT